MRGRKRKPTVLKILTGNPSREPLHEHEPRPRHAEPKCPDHLDKEARRKWRHLVKELTTLGLLTVVDGEMLSKYCQLWSRWVDAEKKIALSGPVLRHEKTGLFYPNPYVAIAFKSVDAMRRIGVEFGLSPSSRARIEVPPQARELDDMERFLGKASGGG